MFALLSRARTRPYALPAEEACRLRLRHAANMDIVDEARRSKKKASKKTGTKQTVFVPRKDWQPAEEVESDEDEHFGEEPEEEEQEEENDDQAS